MRRSDREEKKGEEERRYQRINIHHILQQNFCQAEKNYVFQIDKIKMMQRQRLMEER